MIYQTEVVLLGQPQLMIISFPLIDVTISMRAGGLLFLSYYLPDI